MNHLPESFIEIELSKLVKADWNYKSDDQWKKEKLISNIKRNGQLENIIVRELPTGFYEIVNGNHRFDAFSELGFDKIVSFNLGDISLAQAQRIAVETNETRFDSDPDKLSALLKEIMLEFPDDDLLETLPYTEEEFDELVNSSLEDYPEPESATEDNITANPPIEATTQRGDIYELISVFGEATLTHRLMNGSLAHMLHTDPPYNINYPEFNKARNDASKDWANLYCSDWKDKMSDEEYAMFLADFIKLAKKFMIPMAHYYVWHATSYYLELLNAFTVNEIPYDKVPIQWVKQVAPLSHVRYKRKSEPCVYAGKGAINGNGNGARWFGPNNEVNIWEIARDHNVYYIHPTQKPIALPARAIKNSSQAGEIVLDMFGGSGSTLMAADQLKRNAYLMELGPEFCDLIVGRFAKYKQDFNQEFKILRNGIDYTAEAVALIEKLEIRTAEKTLEDAE